MTKCRINPLAFGLSLGVVWGASVLLMGLLAHFFEYGTAFVTSLGVVYIGYEPSLIGSAIGAVFGFIDALVGGAVIAWLYNCFAGCCKKGADE